jgi:hypothetical protein
MAVLHTTLLFNFEGFMRKKRYSMGVNKFFKTLATLASRSGFSLAKSENNWQKIYRKGT